jgi:hypothetical protein
VRTSAERKREVDLEIDCANEPKRSMSTSQALISSPVFNSMKSQTSYEESIDCKELAVSPLRQTIGLIDPDGVMMNSPFNRVDNVPQLLADGATMNPQDTHLVAGNIQMDKLIKSLYQYSSGVV